jgi:hypothetical protein
LSIFLKFLLSYVSYLYILENNPLSYTRFTNIFFQKIGCLSLCWLFPFLCKSFLVWSYPICLFLLPCLVLKSLIYYFKCSF